MCYLNYDVNQANLTPEFVSNGANVKENYCPRIVVVIVIFVYSTSVRCGMQLLKT